MTENNLHINCATWLKIQYPEVYFTFDPSGEFVKGKDGKGWKRISDMKAKRSNHAHLDMIVMEPKNDFNGLFIEFKKESPFKKNGQLKMNEHYEEQQNTMIHLHSKGYACAWCWEIDQFREIITDYMHDKL